MLKQVVEGMRKCSKASVACMLLGPGRIPLFGREMERNPFVLLIRRSKLIAVFLLENELVLGGEEGSAYIHVKQKRKSDGLREVNSFLACIGLPM